LIFTDTLAEYVGNGDSAGRHAELADQAGGFGDVVVDHCVASLVDGIARGVSGDKGIAVAVAADPGAEGEKFGEFGVDLVNGLERFLQFREEAWKGFEQRHGKVVESHVNFVA